MNHYKLRITIPESYELLYKDCESYICVKHQADEEVSRDHYHYYLNTNLSSDAIRKRIRQHPLYGVVVDGKEMKGNSLFSLGVLEPTEGFDYPLEYFHYLMKPNVYEFWSPTLEHLRQITVDYNESRKQESKAKKRSKGTIIEDIIDTKFQDAVLTEITGIPQPVYLTKESNFFTKEEIVDRVVDYYQEKGTLIRKFQLVSISQTLCLKYIQDYNRELKMKILDEI